MKIVYRLEVINYFHYDEIENENVEERLILGHFTELDKLIESIHECIDKGINEKKIFISSFNVQISSNQQFIYVLSHQYSIINGDQYIDYEYIFQPCSNRNKCLLLKEKLSKDNKYAIQPNRCYDLQPPDGFYISKQRLNHLYIASQIDKTE